MLERTVYVLVSFYREDRNLEFQKVVGVYETEEMAWRAGNLYEGTCKDVVKAVVETVKMFELE